MKFNFINRDISLLYFYNILLEKAANCGLSFFERVRFLAFYSENIEEFTHFRINRYLNKKYEIYEKIVNEINKQHNNQDIIVKEIFKNNDLISLRDNWNVDDKKCVREIYKDSLESSIFKLNNNNADLNIQDNQIYICVGFLEDSIYKHQILGSNLLSKERFIKSQHHYFYLIEEIIEENIDRIFPDRVIKEIRVFRMIRNFNISYRKEKDSSIEVVKKGISNRKQSNFTIGFYESRMSRKMLDFIIDCMNISYKRLVPSNKFQKLGDILKIDAGAINKKVIGKSLKIYKDNIYEEIENGDIFIQYPKYSFNSLIQYIEDIIKDKEVSEIYITWYRFNKNSRIKELLLQAVNNNIKVNIVIELKAKMEEERNLEAYEELKNSGINIILTPNTLKVHAKMLLIVKMVNNRKRYYSYISTGNFNEKTSQAYIDYALLTSNQAIGKEVYQLFQEIVDKRVSYAYQYLLVSPYNMKAKLLENIYSEISNLRSGREAKIFAIMNGLQDKSIITALYEASLAGVKIDIIVRGMCRLVPNKPYSANIRLRRRVSNYLEHERLYYFKNKGNPRVYIGSADWMTKKLTKRLEILVPILDNSIISNIEKDIINEYNNDSELHLI
ncbi:MAG: phospholipase D-like domain-containing protein [Marinifilaceae bacterium]|jgi:polyphosphate kinase|nr:phospholipase D-like domain-containing protein [Marinifilaceae bacterium]